MASPRRPGPPLLAVRKQPQLGRVLLALGVVASLNTVEPGHPQDRGPTVLSIGDGDTIRIRQAGRTLAVRLACIDAPEMAQSPWGAQARRYLQQRLPIGRVVSLDIKGTDRYGRTVAEVISEINVNLVLVEDGLAFADRRFLASCDAREYQAAEFRASRRRYGIWQVEGGITRPWEFRRLPRR